MLTLDTIIAHSEYMHAVDQAFIDLVNRIGWDTALIVYGFWRDPRTWDVCDVMDYRDLTRLFI